MSGRGCAVGVAPVAEAPVAGRIADTCVTHGSCKDIGLRLQIHGHKASVAGSHTTNLVGFYKGVFLAELLRTIDDVLCYTFTGCIDMT